MKNLIIKYSVLVVSLALVIVLTVTLYLSKRIDEEHLESHQFYQYLSGIKFEYSGNIHISKDKSVTNLTFKDINVILDSTPLFYKDEKRVLLPKTMSVVYPLSDAMQYKVNYFSRLYLDKETIYVLDRNLKKSLSNCFLYDGRDLYFFIEETKIKVNKKEIIIPPLSYVVLNYNDNIQIYNYENDELQTIDIDNEEVTASAKGYTINLSIDAISYKEKSRLLIKKMDYLKNLE